MDFISHLSSPAALKEAWGEVRKKGAHGGLDGIEIGNPELESDEWLHALAEELRTGTYVPVPYRGTSIPKFNSEGEWRQLGMPAIRDKVVQWSFRKLVEPIFEKLFYDCSYAYRPGKGPQKAIRRVEHILKYRSCLWACPADIDNFFDSLDRIVLRNLFQKHCPDEKLWILVQLWLSAGVIQRKGNWADPTEGIPQGAVVSPLLANLYLHPLDDFAVMNGYDYVRYSDNFILLSSSEEALLMAYEDVRTYLETNLKLKLNDNPHPVRSLDNGFVFLGIYFRNATRHISYSKERKAIQKMDWMIDEIRSPDPNALIDKINAMTRQKRRYYAFIEPNEQFAKFDDHLENKLIRYLEKLREKNRLFNESEIRGLLGKIQWFLDKPVEERQCHIQFMIDQICKTPIGHSNPSRQSSKASPSVNQEPNNAPKVKNPTKRLKTRPKEEAKNVMEDNAESIGSRHRRATAQKNRYLKQVAGTSKLVLTTTGLFLGKSGERLVVRQQRQNIMECLLKDLQHVDIASHGIGISSDAILTCAEKAIPILFFDHRGQPKAQISYPVHPKGDVTLKQIQIYGTEKAFRLAKAISIGKCHNQINLLKFYRRHRASISPQTATAFDEDLKHMMVVIQKMKQIPFDSSYENAREQLMLLEAKIGAYYWGRMRQMVHPDLCFERRDKQNATDVVNQMLNYGYGILYQRVWQEVLRNGLNPHISFLHAFQESKPTLVYDLVEEFRQPFVDRVIFSMVFRGKHGADLKLTSENRLSDETRKKVISGVLGRLSGLTAGRRPKATGEQIIGLQVRRFRMSVEQGKSYSPFCIRY